MKNKTWMMLFVVVMVGCSRTGEKRTSFSIESQICSDSKNPNSQSLLTEDIENFYKNIRQDMVIIMCWEIDDNYWNCGAYLYGRNQSSRPYITYDEFCHLMYDIPITLKDMAVLLNNFSPSMQSRITVCEYRYGCSEEEFLDVQFNDYYRNNSINKFLYEELGLLDRFIELYGDIEDPTLTDTSDYAIDSKEWIKLYQYYSQNKNYCTYLYCWHDEENEWMCGFDILGNDEIGWDEYNNIQHKYACPLETMAKIHRRNKNIEIDGIYEIGFELINSDLELWNKSSKKIISNNKYLYLKTGLFNLYKEMI